MPPETYLLLISELNGCSQYLRKLGQQADCEVIKSMIIKYNKQYFKVKKEYEQKSKRN